MLHFDLPLKYPPIEPDDFGFGEIRNVGVPELCVDSGYKGRDQVVGIANCAKDIKNKLNRILYLHGTRILGLKENTLF
nr:CAZy families GT27/CBM13 protein [uncultured bacterium]